jgi:uncharacterized protein YxjI
MLGVLSNAFSTLSTFSTTYLPDRVAHGGHGKPAKGQLERKERNMAQHYRVRQKLVAISDDFWIENERGERIYKVDGKALRLRKTLVFEDAGGNELCTIQERKLRIKDSMEIEDPGGRRLAMVKKALIAPLRDRWAVSVAEGPDLEVQGNLLNYEYTIGEGRDKIAEVSKKWFRVADTYGVQIGPGQNDVLILAITVALDSMAHPAN